MSDATYYEVQALIIYIDATHIYSASKITNLYNTVFKDNREISNTGAILFERVKALRVWFQENSTFTVIA